MSEPKANRLAEETSPYLLQHAYNPVDWYPWGEEALAKSKELDRPIFLSIGYSACHWCHVMEHESFEDPATAAVMNEHFINIKVDREERPDLDQIYMGAVQLMTRHGGWPMSVWLTPDLQPFYGGTYFPPQPRYNMPAFKDVLLKVSETWKERRQEVVDSAGQVVQHLQHMGSIEGDDSPLQASLIENAGRAIEQVFDPRWGGIGSAPKFPHSVELRVCLRSAKLAQRDALEHVATYSLEKMIRGGIYDQLGGGFHRYSTDAKWLVPHFEKMLYDNALITLACAEAYQVTKEPIFERAIRETLDYVLREMTDDGGAFYSTQDADSEGVEGKFFVWDKQEILDVLGEERGEVFCRCYDVSPHGNWEGKNILNLPLRLHECAEECDVPLADLEAQLAQCRQELFDVRSKRIWPGRDEKILTSWNGMMIDAMAVASGVLEEPRYADAAVKAAQYLLSTMRRDDGLLYRTCKEGRAHLNGYLEDYAYLANGLISLYEATFDPQWLVEASQIVQTMIDQCWDPQQGGFFFTGNDHETLITRSKDPHDNAIPSGNSMAVTAMSRLYKLTGNELYYDKSRQTLQLFASLMTQSATATAQMLIALGIHLRESCEVAIVGDPKDSGTQELLRVVRQSFAPNKVVAFKAKDDAEAQKVIGWLADKTLVDGKPAAYVCQGFTCQQPVTEPEALRTQLLSLA